MKNAQVENSSASSELAGQGVSKVAIVESVVDGNFMRRLQRLGKRTNNYSARQIGEMFGVTRATFKAWQTGKKVITDDTARRARSLYAEWAKDAKELSTKERERDVLVVTFARGVDSRMRTLEIPRKPRKCDGCGKWFVPVSSRQKRHNVASCRTRAAQKKRRKKK